MRYNYSPDNKIIIRCNHCLNKMRVPLDKGKISVTCPACRKGFVYHPDSIPDTIRQIYLSIKAQISNRLRMSKRVK